MTEFLGKAALSFIAIADVRATDFRNIIMNSYWVARFVAPTMNFNRQAVTDQAGFLLDSPASSRFLKDHCSMRPPDLPQLYESAELEADALTFSDLSELIDGWLITSR